MKKSLYLKDLVGLINEDEWTRLVSYKDNLVLEKDFWVNLVKKNKLFSNREVINIKSKNTGGGCSILVITLNKPIEVDTSTVSSKTETTK